MIAPHTIPVEEQRTQPAGERLIENLLEKADAAVVIGESSSLLCYYQRDTDTAVLDSPPSKYFFASSSRWVLASTRGSNEGS